MSGRKLESMRNTSFREEVISSILVSASVWTSCETCLDIAGIKGGEKV